MKTPFEYIHSNESVPNTLDHEASLLDHFAGLAMQGFISKYGNDGSYNSLAEMSYQVAEAMLKARKEALK